MQDAFTVVLNYDKDPCTDFMGVFDGHGPAGAECARYVACHLFGVVMKKYLENADFPKAIRDGFVELDAGIERELFVRRDRLPRGGAGAGAGTGAAGQRGGSTACAVWIRHGRCYCANVGDSRAVASRRGRAVAVTMDHRPAVTAERNRVLGAGGSVTNDRVDGVLGVTRAFGDFAHKRPGRGAWGARRGRGGPPSAEPVVSVIPHISTFCVREDGVEFVVVATDGVWDVMTNQQVVDFVTARVRRLVPLQAICQDLLTECKIPFCTDVIYGGMAGQDNTTVIIGIFK